MFIVYIHYIGHAPENIQENFGTWLRFDLPKCRFDILIVVCLCVFVYLCICVFGKTKEAISLLRKLSSLRDHWRKATTEGALPKTPLMLLVQSPPSSSFIMPSRWIQTISMTIFYRHGLSQIIPEFMTIFVT